MRSKPIAVTANKGTDIAVELLFFLFLSAANSGHGQRGHRHRGRATNFFVFASRPTAVMANEGTDIAGKLLIFFVFVNWPTAVTADEGTYIAGKLLIFSQQAEWRLRHKGFDIAGELTVCTASPSGLGRRGHKTLQASCVRQHAPVVLAKKGTRHRGRAASQAPAVSATEGRRHCGQASLMVAVVQKGVDGTAHDHA